MPAMATVVVVEIQGVVCQWSVVGLQGERGQEIVVYTGNWLGWDSWSHVGASRRTSTEIVQKRPAPALRALMHDVP